MERKEVFKVLGIKKFKGDIDGQHHDTMKINVLMPVSERNGNERGFSVGVFLVGKADVFDKFKDVKFPVDMELTYEMTTKGMEIYEFRFIPASKAA